MKSIDSLKLEEKIKDIVKEVVGLVLKYKKPERIYLFGSRLRGDNLKKSDIDIAVEDNNFPYRIKNIIKREVEENIRTLLDINLIWLDSVNGNFKKSVLEEGVIIYEKRKNKI